MKQFTRKHPIAYCIIYLFCALLLKKLVMVPIQCSNTSLMIANFAELLILCVEIGITWLVVRKADLVSSVPFHYHRVGKGLLWGIPGILMVALILYLNVEGNFWSDVPLLIVYTMKNFSIGLMEESIIRGLFLGLMMLCWKGQNHGCYKAVFLSSLIFAFGHLGNLLNGDVNRVIVQVIYAFFLGVFFAAITLQSNNLWGAVIIHSLIDFAAGIGKLIVNTSSVVSQSKQPVTSFSITKILTNDSLLIALPIFIYGVIAMILYQRRKSKQ